MTSTEVRPARVTARGWGWRHGGRGRAAVAGLDLDIEPGEKVLLLGPSGAGKSTLLHALAGVLGSSEDDDADETGALLVDGRSPREARGRAGLVQQDPETQVILGRVGDDVAFGAENLAVAPAEIWGRVRQALDDVGLGSLPLDHPTHALSGGQKQRLALAGVLAMRPGLVLLDEPTANLDPAGVLEVRDAVIRAVAATGATLLVVEHRVEVWKDVVDRVVVLGSGRQGSTGAGPSGVVASGPPSAVLDARGDSLAAQGVWVPGRVPALKGTAPRGAGETLLDARHLAVSRAAAMRRGFGSKAPAPVLSDVSLTLESGRALSVTGPNGAGKSTLALTLAGLLAPVRGAVVGSQALLAAGGSVPRHPEPHRWRAKELITRIGTVFQEPEHQFVTGTVLDELRFGPRQLGRGEDRVDELLQRLRLENLVDANPYTLSGGEKRRLSVATVLAAHPRLLILDEPTFGQDANTWAELGSLLLELLADGVAVLSVTHDADFTRALGASEFAAGSPATAERSVTVGKEGA
ncbi:MULTISPECIES: ABC transporter ATP-binding protein [Arthrobacter]|uniref:ATP-binding cassette domain-containing protein n=2 Tax=Arthrobacter TaxID=1663 RepID=A0ABU9KKC1_9MICC|nr:ABC transporter ATP-binding protein [Arthrobacter sp. YJM1]MDP5226736.1 ATP-binding cassette domain-containing protein [Arthrobacter sp. YJM1]